MFLVWGIYNLFKNGLLRSLLAAWQPGETGHAVAIGLSFALCILFSYLLGSINFALVISKLFYHDDIRKYGSGNAGATNMARTYGKKAAVATFLCDGLKGVISILFACLIFAHPMSEPYYFYYVTAVYFSAFFCIFGHVFPCFSHFKGGKGFATTALTVIALNPFIAAILLAIYIPLVAMTRYISLGSVIISLFYPILLSSFDSITVQYGISTFVSLLIAALVTWAHRENLKRIYHGNERKIKLWHKEPDTSAGAEDNTNDKQ